MTCEDCIHYEICTPLCSGIDMNLMMKDKNVELLCSNFKDKSRLIELPCKVGDKLYCLSRRIIDGKFSPLFVDERIVDSFEYSRDGLIVYDTHGLDLNEIFLTREEAEKALVEGERNESVAH